MHGATVEQLDFVAGGSPELAAAFQTVADTEVDGQPKFSPRTCRKMTHSVVCRAYGPAMLEVCHLITVAEACGRRPRRYEAFFWDSGPACTAGFRAHVDRELFGQAEAAPHVTADHAKVDITYADRSFAISYSRMPFLSAMVEFLVTVLGYGELDELWQEMLSRGPTAASVSDAANRLSRRLYGYLKDHLTSAQNHRKFSSLAAFLKDHEGGDFGPATIEDPVVLDFWLARSGEDNADSPDFRTFTTVFRAFVRLRQVLEQVNDFRALRDARPIGPDREAGEVDPDSILSLVENIEEAGNPLLALREPPVDAVKFLNKTEAAELELLVDCGKVGLALPLSLLRCEVFGAAQARITQAQRRKVTPEGLEAVIEGCAQDDYVARRTRLDRLAQHTDRILLASLEVLAAARRPEAVTLVASIRPDIDLRPLAKLLVAAGDSGNIVALDSPAVRERLIAAMACPETVGPDLAALMGQAGKSLKSLSRQGFGEVETARPGAEEGFASAVPPLLQIREKLAAFRRKLDRMRQPRGGWEEQFEADREIFCGQFRVLYGVAP